VQRAVPGTQQRRLKTTVKNRPVAHIKVPPFPSASSSTLTDDNTQRFERMFSAQQLHQNFGQYIFAELALAVSATSARLCVVEGEPTIGRFRFIATFGANSEVSKSEQKLLRTCVTQGRSTESRRNGNLQTLMPIYQNRKVIGVMSFTVSTLDDSARALLEFAASRFGIVLEAIESDAHTNRLLRQSESLTRELQNQQVWLKHTNDELAEKARLLAVQKVEMETRNREIEQARHALQEQAQQLVLTSRYKSEFLANMSHELRTPLNSMLLLARQLMENREQTLTPKQLEFSKIIHAAGQELLQLVNDILDLAKIDAGKISIEIGDYNPRDLPEFVERNFRLLAESRNLELKVELHRKLPKLMQTDALRLEQILKNLLSNALKFTNTGRVTLRVKPVSNGWTDQCSTLNEAPAVIAFAVEDTGIGIAPDKQKLIFEAFQQADGSTSRQFGGTGLGLTISRELAALLGGEIQLQSEPGKGSTFTLYAPQTTLAPVAPAHELRERPKIPGSVLVTKNPAMLASLRGRTAVIVDDDIRNIFALTSLLERFQMNVLSAEEGQGALALIKSAPDVDVVLMDIMMPGMDGFAVIQKLRSNGRFKNLPIIAVTAQAMKEDRAKCMRAGASDYIPKPIEPDLLLNALKNCLP
jgi:signal transduction histidine kinase